VEALVLEINLIKKHRPKYNILMKDDKNLVYIKITSSIVPEVIKTRKKTKD
jgi:excinuclease ABC subunit C